MMNEKIVTVVGMRQTHGLTVGDERIELEFDSGDRITIPQVEVESHSLKIGSQVKISLNNV